MTNSTCVEANVIQIETGEWGLHARARRQVKAGTVLTRNSALCHILNDSNQRCESCLGSFEKLYRCSSCHVIQYCGRDCQKRDFCQHKLECKVMSKEPRYVDSAMEVKQEIRLILRFFAMRSFLLRKEKNLCCCVGEFGEDGVGTIACGLDHLGSMAQVPIRLSQTCARTVEISAKWISSEPSFDVEKTLRTFQANNFGILDALHNTIGQGVYPHAAILNHSCDPSCILRFVKSDIEIVALRDITKGEELTHSYVDLVNHTITRHQHLSQLHGFVCSCKRCQGEIKISLPRHPTDDLYKWVVSDRNPLENKPIKEPLYLLDIDEAMVYYGGNELSSSMIEEGRQLLQNARAYIGDDNFEAEKQALTQAIRIFEDGPQLSLNLYEARCLYLSVLLLSGKEIEARHQCLAIMSFLLVVLPENHPLIGLQLYTLADLTADISIYQWSRKILRVSHGNNHELVRSLDERLKVS